MAESSAADLLQQMKDFMQNAGSHEQEESASNSNRSSVRNFADLLKLLPSDNQSKTSFHGAESVEFSEWPYPIRLQSTAMGVVLGAYTLIIVASLMGNLLVLFVIGKMRRMHRSVTNIFLLNVAVSDILITVLNIPFNLVRVLSEEWPFGSLMCSVIPFIQVAAVYSASWTMVCIAVDRLIVTVYPLRPRMPIHTGIALVILVWTFSILGALPYALIHQTVTAISFTTSIRCIAIFPAPEVTYRRYLSLITFLFQFCIPLSITGICYGKISQKLWFSHNFFSVNTGLLNGGFLSVQNAGLIIRNRQRSIKMLILVVVVFATCWLPISVYHLRRDFEDLNGPTSHSIFLFLLLHWTAMSSTCYSPFIYCCWNSCYRSQAKIIYGFLCFCLPKTSAKELRQQVTIRGLVVRFRGNTRDTAGSDELGNPSQNGMKSFNWDSVVGTREMLSFHEGHRTYRTA